MSTAVELTAGFPGTAPDLRGRMIYFAHPIDLNTLNESQRRRMIDLVNRVYNAGAVVYDPAGAFNVLPGIAPSGIVAQINRNALQAADAVIACFPESTGVGVAMEIQAADSAGCPSAVLTDAGTRSWALAGLEHAYLFSHPSDPDILAWLAEEAAEYASVRQAPPQEETPLWVQLQPDGQMPVRKHADDCAFDLFVSQTTKIEVGQIRDVPAGCSLQLPEGVWGLVLGRSSTSRTHKLLVHPGVIDTGYRGEMFIQVENIGEAEFLAEAGMRLGQIIPLPNLAARMAAVQTVVLEPSERGPAGFGSTGN